MKTFLLRSLFQTPIRPNLRSTNYLPHNPSSCIGPQSHIVNKKPPPIINTTSQQPAVMISLVSKSRNFLATNFVDGKLIRYPSPSSSSATSLINSVQTSNNFLLSEKKKEEEDEQYSSSFGAADSSSASSEGTWVAVIGKLTGTISIGMIVLLMLGMVDDDGHKALALGGGGGPGGPMVEEFWENVRRYALYALTVSTGVIYTVFQPIAELLKNPISAILVLIIIGGTIYIVSQVLSAMVGVSEFNYEYGY